MTNPEPPEYLAEYHERSRIATASAMPLLTAIRPLFSLPTRRYPEQVASCVLLNLGEHCFALSAAHAFHPHKKSGLLIGCGDQLHPLNGDVFNSPLGESGEHYDDPIDAAVLHLTSDIPDEVRASCLTLENLDFEAPREGRFFHLICGFRSKSSRVDAISARSKLEGYATIEYGDHVYAALDVQRQHHVLLAYQERTIVRRELRTVPTPRGMSGGAIFKIHGLPGTPRLPISVNPRPDAKLSAIFIERRPPCLEGPAALLGTRLAIHLGLIKRFLPGTI
jgi:hypothetical protein